MKKYISIAKYLLDHIMVARDVISKREQVLYVIGSLDSNYTSLMKNITGKKYVISLMNYSFEFVCMRDKENK